MGKAMYIVVSVGQHEIDFRSFLRQREKERGREIMF